MGCVDRMRRKKIIGGNQRKGRSEGDGTNPTRIGHPPSRLAGTVIHVVIISLYYRKIYLSVEYGGIFGIGSRTLINSQRIGDYTIRIIIDLIR